MVHALRIMRLATETSPTEHTMDQRIQLNPVRRLVLGKATNTPGFSTQKNATVETMFQGK